jgi:hypothetical protein
MTGNIAMTRQLQTNVFAFNAALLNELRSLLTARFDRALEWLGTPDAR